VKPAPLNVFANTLGWLLLFLVLTGPPVLAAEQRNLLSNPDFSLGHDNLPDDWSQGPDDATRKFDWLHSDETPAQLLVSSDHAASGQLKIAGYWSQHVDLEPGWYYLSTEVRTENDSSGAGAMLMVCGEPPSSDQSSHRSNPLCGRTASLHSPDWKDLGVYVRVDEAGQTFDVRLGVGPHGGTTKAYFRSAKLTYSGSPPVESTSKIDFPQLRLRALGYRVLIDRSSLVAKVFSYRTGVEFLLGVIVLALLDHRLTDASQKLASKKDSKCHSSLVEEDSLTTAALTRIARAAEFRGSIAVALIFSTAFLGIYVVDRIEFIPGLGLVHEHPGTVAGDEPHYLMVVNSLLFDHDFQLQDDYTRVTEGGLEAGARFRGVDLDHHTVVVNRRSGHHSVGASIGGIWRRNSNPEFAPSKDVYEVSAHPLALPLLLALTIWPFHPAPDEVEGDTAAVLGTIAWLAVLATYFLGRRIGLSRFLATSAAMLLLLGSPWLAYTRSFFREPTLGFSLVLMLWAAVDDSPIGTAITAVAAAAIRPAYVFVGACLVGEEFREGRWKVSLRMALALGLSLLVLVIFSLWLRGTVVRSGLRLQFKMTGRFDTLFDTHNGLLIFAPWSIVGLVASFAAVFSFLPQNRALRRMAGPLAINLVATTAFAPGFCYGPRYWVPFLPWLALATVLRLQRAGTAIQVVAGILILLSISIAIPGAICYPEIFTKTPLEAWRMIASPPVSVSL